MQPSDIAVELRPRTPWEAIDLGLAMLQRWWHHAYASHAVVLVVATALAFGTAAWTDLPWLAFVLVWWLKPLYDRVVLHVLSRAVFGELQGVRAAFGHAREWLGSGLLMALTFGRIDMARSFNLPVVQLEGTRGSAARQRRNVLGRRARGHAVWLTVICLQFEMVLYWSLLLFATMLLPATAIDTRELFDGFARDAGWRHALAYAGAVLVLEPFYVAAGFALYLNRRTLLEGWDLEVALRRLAARAAPAILLLVIGALPLMTLAQPAAKDPRREIAEVLKAPEFGYEREVTRWVPRASDETSRITLPDFTFGKWVAKAAQIILWALVAAALAYVLWWVVRTLPWRRGASRPQRYQAPASLFGMELAPEKLPADVAAAALALLREGKAREALALLYRGTLSRLVHQRGVELQASHTEMEVLALAPSDYLRELIEAWRSCAYADRAPPPQAIERLASGYAAL